jgi:hypothetical protein
VYTFKSNSDMEYENFRGKGNLQEKALQDNNVEVRL